MRNPDRLDTFYEELKRIHKEYYPDWRFGQLISNIWSWYGQDIFFLEEDKMITLVNKFVEATGSPYKKKEST